MSYDSIFRALLPASTNASRGGTTRRAGNGEPGDASHAPQSQKKVNCHRIRERQLESRTLPDAIGRPLKGEHYVVQSRCTAFVLTMWRAPFTGGYETSLPPGLKFLVTEHPADSATASAARPEPYADWEVTLVEQRDLTAENYNGYYIVVPFDQVAANCVLVAPEKS